MDEQCWWNIAVVRHNTQDSRVRYHSAFSPAALSLSGLTFCHFMYSF